MRGHAASRCLLVLPAPYLLQMFLLFWPFLSITQHRHCCYDMETTRRVPGERQQFGALDHRKRLGQEHNRSCTAAATIIMNTISTANHELLMNGVAEMGGHFLAGILLAVHYYELHEQGVTAVAIRVSGRKNNNFYDDENTLGPIKPNELQQTAIISYPECRMY